MASATYVTALKPCRHLGQTPNLITHFCETGLRFSMRIARDVTTLYCYSGVSFYSFHAFRLFY